MYFHNYKLNVMRLFSFSLPIFLYFLIFACSGSNSESSPGSVGLMDSESYEMVEDVAQQPNQNNEVNSTEQKIIKTGSISFETKDAEITQQSLIDLTKSHKGYITNQSSYSDIERENYSLTIRIPSSKFDDFIRDINVHINKIENQTINSQDVTSEFIDVQARLKTKKELEARYITLLQKASTVEDILRIESEIGELRSDIESFEGRLKYLKDQTSMSTLNVNFYQTTGKDFGFAGKMMKGLKQGWTNMLNFIVGIAHIWPFIILLILLILGIRRFNRRKVKKYDEHI